RPPVDLTFANRGVPITNDSKSPAMGGVFGGSNCITAATMMPSGSRSQPSGILNLQTLLVSADSAFNYTGNLQLKNNPGKQVDPDKSKAVYVTGDVYISDNITYNTAGWSIDSLPSFVLSVTGNIYIDASVTRLDGTYFAQKNSGGGGGNIYTCSNGFTPIAKGSLFSNCNRQLTVVGSFVADKINFLRTFGSLRDESTGPNVNCSNAAGRSSTRPTCAAEVFEFSPELYLQRPAAASTGGDAVQFDAITSLPPVL
ncbi:MAG: hypothetical protein ABIV43_03305, partial [Candidatus Saccharimonadales bacterium]